MDSVTFAPTADAELNRVLSELLRSVQAILGPNMVGAYLQGSFAAGDWDAHSDVDFVVAIQQDLSAPELAALQAMHARIYALESAWAQHLEGSYVPVGILRTQDPQSTALWYLDNGSRELIRSSHDNTLVVRWVLREHGIALAGPPAAELIDPVDPQALRAEVIATMRDWAASLFAQPEQMANRWYQPFAVISYCRMLQTLHSGRIESKAAGVAWGLRELDQRWTGLIERAWAARPDPAQKAQQAADPAELRQTLAFLEYALAAIPAAAAQQP